MPVHLPYATENKLGYSNLFGNNLAYFVIFQGEPGPAGKRGAGGNDGIPV